jgi:hypothetical protein
MSFTSSASFRAALAALVAVVLVTFAAPDVDAGSRVRPYREGGAIRLDTDLLSASGVSAWAIDEYLAANTPLPKLGTAFLAAERRYGINARFLLAAAMHESNWGRSPLSRSKHNLFGYNAYDRDPSRYATAFSGYARGIDQVARFMKQAYLTPSGRWWMGAPTLRAMQRCWSSSGSWGVNVSRIATSLKLDSLRKRRVRFDAPVLPDVVRTGEALPVRLTWRGGRIPNGVTYRATWTQVAGEVASASLDREALAMAFGDPGATDSVAAPGSLALARTPASRALAAPVTVKAKRSKLGRTFAGLRVATPSEPGEYVLRVTLRDRDGKVLPKADKVSIPAVRVRVFGEWAVRYGTERVGVGGLRVTVTNVGHRAIPISPLPATVADRLGRPDVRDTELVLHAWDRTHPDGTALATMALTKPLAPGASVTLVVADLRATARADVYLVPELIVYDDPLRLDASAAAGFWFRPAGPPGSP